MKDMLSKEHYCCKINKLFINEKQCFPSSFMIFQNSQLPFKQGVADGGGVGGEWGWRGGVHTVNGVQLCDTVQLCVNGVT